MYRLKLFVVIFFFAVAGAFAIGWFGYLGGNPADNIVVTGQGTGVTVKIKEPYRFVFSRPVERTTLEVSFDPPVEGVLEFEKPLFGNHLYKEAVFTPLYGWRPGQTYKVHVRGIKNAAGGLTAREAEFVFVTEPAPRVEAIDVGAPQDAVGLTPTVTVMLDKPNTSASVFFETEPAVEWQVRNEGANIKLTPTRPLLYNTQYTLSVKGSLIQKDAHNNAPVFGGEEWLMYRTTFRTKPPASVRSWVPTGDMVEFNTPVVIDFGEPVAVENLKNTPPLQIFPQTEGIVAWKERNQTLEFVPSNGWLPDTYYRISITPAVRFADGTGLSSEKSLLFKTKGPVKVSSLFPKNDMTGVDVATRISFTFTQAMNQKNVESLFSVEPPLKGKFVWEDKTMHFVPEKQLAFATAYVVRLKREAQSLVGTTLPRDVEVKFTTQQQTTQLPVVMDYQDRALSCEAATLKMALSHYGVSVTENEIMDFVGYDPTPHKGNVWGDPDKAFVGNIDGQQNTTGYGVHWDPIARAGNMWRPSEAFVGWTLSQMLAEVEAGHPVIVWGVYPGGAPDSWVTPEDKQINAWRGEHTRLIVGFSGSKENPTRIIALDPFAGKQFWSPGDFTKNLQSFGMSGVVVR